MLSGQEISIMDSIIIGITGVCIVMLMLAFIALFVVILSKVMALIPDREENKTKAAPAPAPVSAPPAPPAAPAIAPAVVEDDSEIAAVMSVVIEESGCQPEQIIFKSIMKRS